MRQVLPIFAIWFALSGVLATALPVRAAANAPSLKWQRGGCFASWCQTGWYGSPAVADLDGDGAAEVVWGSYDVVAVNGENGTLQWRASGANRVWGGVGVADIDSDGTLEVVAGRGGDALTVYGASGALKWSASPFGGGELRSMALFDLDGDGSTEVVVGRASGGGDRQLSVYSAQGALRHGFPAPRTGDPGYGWGMYNQNVAIADLNGDGKAELIGPTDTHYITALDLDGNQLPVHARYGAGKIWRQVGVHVSDAVDLRGYAVCGAEHRPNWANSAPSIADLDGDGTLEIVAVGNVYNCAANPYASLYEMPFVFKLDRSRWAGSGHDWLGIPSPEPGAGPKSEDYNEIESNQPNPVLADLDGDGEREILFPSYDGRMHAIWLDKTEHGNWPYSLTVGGQFRFASEPVVADLDSDGSAEVIFTTWTRKSSNTGGQLVILDAHGTLLHAVNLPRSSGTSDGALGAPTLGNIDSDAELEIVVGTINTGLVAYDLPGSANARVLWGTGRGSYLRNGLAPAACKVAAVLPGTPPTGPHFIYLPLAARPCR
jgi:FG-GAP-like repeat